MIASHYAEPAVRVLARSTTLRAEPSADAAAIAELSAGAPFALLDNSLGWAWGYGGDSRRVGYVPSSSLV